jgi:hypothetical protein
MYVQEFITPWPMVLHEIDEYIALTNLSLGKERFGNVHLKISRRLVTAEVLQPHVSHFRNNFVKQFARLQLDIAAEDSPAHKVTINYKS